MGDYLRLYGCLIGLLLATSVQAQVPGRSRLELGRKSTPTTSAVTTGKTQRVLLPLPRPMSPMDHLFSQGKNLAMRDYYRSLLIAAPTSSTKATVSRTGGMAEGTVSGAITERSSEEAVRIDERMYSSDRLTVSNIYPNPAHDVAEIDYVMNSNVGSASITLLGILGAPIAEYTLDRNDRKVRLQTRDLPTGYYFYQLSVEGVKVATKKLLVKHQ
ncbi:T9SS type A sorting domain-containing protein [Fibrella sp. HMF5405]|uniref:T9SS type A sorting domain-containing protein n=1 Tax=Fibrella forsythiae TaxID=2817061 RepID=A0ABS3JGF4_9BACT|nr:T9SS type A sorting domain-containing protein [Fibrella forsythiae]